MLVTQINGNYFTGIFQCDSTKLRFQLLQTKWSIFHDNFICNKKQMVNETDVSDISYGLIYTSADVYSMDGFWKNAEGR